MTFTGEYTELPEKNFLFYLTHYIVIRVGQTSVENVPDCRSEDTGCSMKELKYHIKAILALM